MNKFYNTASVPKFQKYKSTHRILSQSETRVLRTLLKLLLIRFAKYDEDVYPCSLVIRSGSNPPLPTPSLRRQRLLHAWIIERETREEPTDTFIDFPREEGKIVLGGLRKGTRKKGEKF